MDNSFGFSILSSANLIWFIPTSIRCTLVWSTQIRTKICVVSIHLFDLDLEDVGRGKTTE